MVHLAQVKLWLLKLSLMKLVRSSIASMVQKSCQVCKANLKRISVKLSKNARRMNQLFFSSTNSTQSHPTVRNPKVKSRNVSSRNFSHSWTVLKAAVKLSWLVRQTDLINLIQHCVGRAASTVKSILACLTKKVDLKFCVFIRRIWSLHRMLILKLLRSRLMGLWVQICSLCVRRRVSSVLEKRWIFLIWKRILLMLRSWTLWLLPMLISSMLKANPHHPRWEKPTLTDPLLLGTTSAVSKKSSAN